MLRKLGIYITLILSLIVSNNLYGEGEPAEEVVTPLFIEQEHINYNDKPTFLRPEGLDSLEGELVKVFYITSPPLRSKFDLDLESNLKADESIIYLFDSVFTNSTTINQRFYDDINSYLIDSKSDSRLIVNAVVNEYNKLEARRYIEAKANLLIYSITCLVFLILIIITRNSNNSVVYIVLLLFMTFFVLTLSSIPDVITSTKGGRDIVLNWLKGI